MVAGSLLDSVDFSGFVAGFSLVVVVVACVFASLCLFFWRGVVWCGVCAGDLILDLL